jgi:hypothetical protein
MGLLSAAVIPVTAIVGVLVAVTRPLGSRSVILIVAVLAVAGIVLLSAGFVSARGRRR